MSEQNISQVETKISEFLGGDRKENCLKFVKYLYDNQMQLEQWWDDTSWRIPYGKDYLCSMGIDGNIWVIKFFMGDYKGDFNEEFLRTVYEHVNSCCGCHADNTAVCPNGKDMLIFGKEFKNACIQFTIRFENPDENDIEHIKKLIDYYKNVASDSESWHAH